MEARLLPLKWLLVEAGSSSGWCAYSGAYVFSLDVRRQLPIVTRSSHGIRHCGTMYGSERHRGCCETTDRGNLHSLLPCSAIFAPRSTRRLTLPQHYR
jgi:hypothetical protein